jgi:hypothetical protein
LSLCSFSILIINCTGLISPKSTTKHN